MLSSSLYCTLLYGSTSTTSIGNEVSSASSSIHRHCNPPRRSYVPIRPTSSELSMVGAGGLSPEPEGVQQQRRWTDYITPDLEAPTATEQGPTVIAQIPPRPKIVVFGATGRIGRRVVAKLLSSGVDMDVVAFVRDSQKLERVLFDEEDLVMGNLMENGSGGRDHDEKKRNKGPQLQVVVGDVVSRGDFVTDGEKTALDRWVNRAKRYFRSRGSMAAKVDNSTATTAFDVDETTEVASDVHSLEWGGDEALRDAVSGSTILISCLGTFRPSNLWTDYLCVPLVRVFRKNAGKWSSDPRHPYFVNYLSTKKILDAAEREQRSREDAVRALEEEKNRLLLLEGRKKRRREEEEFKNEIAQGLRKKRRDGLNGDGHGNDNAEDDAVELPEKGQLPSSTDRIKFIRLSHLMVGHNPFRIWNVITNILWSQLSRFEHMGDMLMESSRHVDTIVLRPGDLTNDERVPSHTSLQLSIDGKVPYPALVGREDVADLTVVLALTKTCRNETKTSTEGPATTSGSGLRNKRSQPSHHYAWAVRWTGQHLSPPQGLRPDGFPSAALCFAKAIKDQIKADTNRRRKEKRIMTYHGGRELIKLKRWRQRMKPYIQSLAISIPLYATLGLLSWYVYGRTLTNAFLGMKPWNVLPQILLKLLPS